MARFAAVGAGRMGRGIAIAFAYAGHRIALVDLRRRTDEQWLADAWQRAQLVLVSPKSATPVDEQGRVVFRAAADAPDGARRFLGELARAPSRRASDAVSPDSVLANRNVFIASDGHHLSRRLSFTEQPHDLLLEPRLGDLRSGWRRHGPRPTLRDGTQHDRTATKGSPRHRPHRTSACELKVGEEAADALD